MSTALNPTCPDCGAPMMLRETERFKTKTGSPRKFYGCSRFPKCMATHGAHPDGRPLGVPGNAETKAARGRAHAAFDAIWQDGRLTRHAAYAWLAAKLGGESHMGAMGVEQCERVVMLCEAFDASDPDAIAAAEKSAELAAAQKAKWKLQRKNWTNAKKTRYNRAKRKRQKANRAARMSAEEEDGASG